MAPGLNRGGGAPAAVGGAAPVPTKATKTKGLAGPAGLQVSPAAAAPGQRAGPVRGPVGPARPRAGAPDGAADKPMAAADGEGDYDWKAPAGQTGDGKTSLNARFGY